MLIPLENLGYYGYYLPIRLYPMFTLLLDNSDHCNIKILTEIVVICGRCLILKGQENQDITFLIILRIPRRYYGASF